MLHCNIRIPPTKVIEMTDRKKTEFVSEAEILRQAEAYRAQVIADYLANFFGAAKPKAPAAHPVAAE